MPVEAELRTWTEAQFQTWVKNAAEAVGGYHYHTRDSRGSEAAYPDSTIVLPPRVIYAELKKVGGAPTEGQLEVLRLLQGCPGVEAYLWDPLDWREIEEVLGIYRGRIIKTPPLLIGCECSACGASFSSRSRRSRACSAACKAQLWEREATAGRRPGRRPRAKTRKG